jgi:lipid-A-disaccharide synthase
MQASDILILSNGPGEVATWVRPMVRALRQQLGDDRQHVRLSLVLAPCNNATGQEAAIARRYPELDRVQGAEAFWPFLLSGSTQDNWEWRSQGVVLFLGGDQAFAVLIGRRLGYPVVTYAEWDARWPRWVSAFGVMTPKLIEQAPAAYRHKYHLVGDLMAEAGSEVVSADTSEEWIGLLPGSKASKLQMGVPFLLAIAQEIRRQRPSVRFLLPLAPTLQVETLLRYADPARNLLVPVMGGPQDVRLEQTGDRRPSLETADGLQVELHTEFPAYEALTRCRLCLTTVGANTAELGSLGIPMIVLLPTQQLDAMRSWDGLPGLLANLPGVGSLFAKLINGLVLSRGKLLAWPNIWAGEMIVPELVGRLQASKVAALALNWLAHPETLTEIRQRLRQSRGEPGAASRLAALVAAQLQLKQ